MYLPLLLIAIPICSVIIIILNSRSINDNNDSTMTPKVIAICLILLVIWTLIDAQTKNPFADFSNIFDMLGNGFYITVLASVYYLIDLLIIKNDNPVVLTKNTVRNNMKFCTNCGEKYNVNNAGNFCDKCGSEL